jgi:hypothetical protein
MAHWDGGVLKPALRYPTHRPLGGGAGGLGHRVRAGGGEGEAAPGVVRRSSALLRALGATEDPLPSLDENRGKRGGRPCGGSRGRYRQRGKRASEQFMPPRRPARVGYRPLACPPPHRRANVNLYQRIAVDLAGKIVHRRAAGVNGLVFSGRLGCQRVCRRQGQLIAN